MIEFVLITPHEKDIDKLLNAEGFLENSQLIDSLPLILKYGNKAFLVDKEWLKTLINK